MYHDRQMLKLTLDTVFGPSWTSIKLALLQNHPLVQCVKVFYRSSLSGRFWHLQAPCVWSPSDSLLCRVRHTWGWSSLTSRSAHSHCLSAVDFMGAMMTLAALFNSCLTSEDNLIEQRFTFSVQECKWLLKVQHHRGSSVTSWECYIDEIHIAEFNA